MKKFTRRSEDFVCENCGTEVKGNGYTNHCPNCLHSKHVDINPGDRQATCLGQMVPIAVAPKGDGYTITQKCQKCGHVRANKSAPNDNFEALLAIAEKQATGGRL